MGKKYTPSGYQIIDLGIITVKTEQEVTINKGENTDADVLIDLSQRGRLADKPILLKFFDEEEDLISGFATLCGQTLSLPIVSGGRYSIAVGNDKIIISKIV